MQDHPLFQNHSWLKSSAKAVRQRSKTFLVMKLSAVILLATCLQVSAKSDAQTVSLSVKDAPLEEVFTAIRKQTDYLFFYKSESIASANPVTINVKDKPVEDVLKLCLDGQGFDFAIKGRTIYIVPIIKKVKLSNTGSVVQQIPSELIDVKGRVVNENGDPVPGVTVTVKGSKTFTVTDKNGEFKLKTIDHDAVLVFTHISMETFELKVSGKTELAINLKAKISALEGVTIVNTGYEQVPKERVTGSFEFVNTSELNRRVSSDILSRLEGVTTSLLFDRRKLPANTHQIDANNIIIRGLSTITEKIKSPLIIINNFPYDGDINNINPNDIESVTVLKDAAAASIWGARAGNGVIVITTKQGKFNQSPKISFNSNINLVEKPDLFHYPRMSTSEYIDVEIFLFNMGYYNSAVNNTTTRPPVTPVVEILANRRNGHITSADSALQIDALRGIDVRNDFERYVYRMTTNQQYALSISGGSEKIKYSLSGGVDINPMTLVGNKMARKTLRSDNTLKLLKNLDFQVGVSYSVNDVNTNSLGDFGNSNYGLKTGATLYPYAKLASPNGIALDIAHDYRQSYLDTAGAGKLLDWKYRPLDEIQNNDKTSKLEDIVLNFGAIYYITKGLDLRLSYQYERTHTFARNFWSEKTYYTRDKINSFTQIQGNDITRAIPLGGIIFEDISAMNSQSGRAQISFSKIFKTKHQISAISGIEIRDRQITNRTGFTYGFNENTYSGSNVDFANRYPLYVRGTAQISSGESSQKLIDRFVSIFGNFAYTYDRRYTISLSSRKDAANLFGIDANNKWKPLWSIGGSWELSNETFYNLNTVSYLRLRATYGYQGNVNNTLSPNAIIRLNPPANNPLGINLVSANIIQPGDPSLSWETINQINLGLDFKFLGERITGSIDYFRKSSDNLIYKAIVDPTTGIESVNKNSASIQSKGIEFTFRSLNFKGNFSWQSEITFNYTRNKITDYFLDDKGRFIGGSSGLSIFPLKGRDPYEVISLPFAGLDPLTGEPLIFIGKEKSKNYNSIVRQAIDTAHLIYHGSGIPRYFGLLNNVFSFKGFSFISSISYRFDYHFYKDAINYGALYKSGQTHRDYSKRWKKPGDEQLTDIPAMIYPANANRDIVYSSSSINVLKGDNIRLDYVKISYDFTKLIKNRMPIERFQIYCNINNIGVLWRANKENLDPDYDRGNGAFPPLKSIAFGFTTTF